MSSTEELADIRFDGQVVVVTGAGRGLGRCHALLLAERGAQVVVNDVDRDAASAVVAAITSAGGLAVSAAGDVVTDAPAVVAAGVDAWGRLDALVNNAGVPHSKPFPDIGADEFDTVLRTHVHGTVAMTRAAWPALLVTDGRVVNTASGSLFGLESSTAYTTAKGAIFGFTRSLACDAAGTGIRVNAILPMARTRMYELSGGVAGSAEDRLLTERFPPEAVAPVVAYLASSTVPFTGRAFEVAGGTMSLVALGIGPAVPAPTPEAVAAAVDSLLAGPITATASLAYAMAAKLG